MPTNADNLHAFLRTRRSTRRFKPEPIVDEVVARILATATFAPSAHNLQPWRFAVVATSVVKTRLGESLTNAMRADMQAEGASKSEIEARVVRSLRRLDEAPVVIILCRDVIAVNTNAIEETIMSIQSVAAAGLQLLLAAHAEGLGGNWICWPLYAQRETRQALELPDTWEPQAMFILGRANEAPKPKSVTSIEKITIQL